MEQLIDWPVNGYVYLNGSLPLLAYRWTCREPLGLELGAERPHGRTTENSQRWTLA